jgi:hypothetical protein
MKMLGSKSGSNSSSDSSASTSQSTDYPSNNYDDFDEIDF